MVQLIAIGLAALGIVTFVTVGWHKYNSAIEGKVAAEALLKTCSTNYAATLTQVGHQNKALETLAGERDAAQELAKAEKAKARADAVKREPELARLRALAAQGAPSGECPSGQSEASVRKGLKP